MTNVAVDRPVGGVAGGHAPLRGGRLQRAGLLFEAFRSQRDGAAAAGEARDGKRRGEDGDLE